MAGYITGDLVSDLWWFIENVSDEDPTRHEQFFALRERVRERRADERQEKPSRFKCTGSNVAYIHCTKHGDWVCTLSDGTPASMFYAVGNCDETALKFLLEDAESDNERLLILRSVAGGHVRIEEA